MPYLTPDEITEVVNAAVAAGFGKPGVRGILLSAINQDYANGNLFDNGGPPSLQLYSDLGAMNSVDQLNDGSVPLRDWLRRAGNLARDSARTEAEVFTKFETRVAAEASGQPAIPDPSALREVINNENIVHHDDMVDFLFLAAGTLAGNAVAKLLVPRYENGAAQTENQNPRQTLGTGWLLTDRLVMTNHHVIQFRRQGEPPASDGDLRLQAEHAIVKFDYDQADDNGLDVQVEKLEAWDKELDFAILRLKDSLPRPALRIQKHAVIFSPGMYLPVNIIQHPSGHPKRVAMRNNLLTDANALSIRYFTDTLAGSSGSPVFDDGWRVIALHRGSAPVNNVSYQGRDTAVVNVGTQITAILSYLDQHAAALRQEIAV